MPETVIANSPIDKALALQARGFHVFPCKSDKTPACAHGHLAATDDPVVLRVLFARPDAVLVGISCPASHIHVLDIDPLGEPYYQQHKGELPATVEIRTRRGGRHLIFRADDPSVVVRQGARNGIDTRSANPGHGGYIIAWGEAHEYDRNRMSAAWPAAFVAGAWASPRFTGNGGTVWLQPPGEPGGIPAAFSQTIADEIRMASWAGGVPPGEQDNFLVRAYGHALKAVQDGWVAPLDAIEWCGRVNTRWILPDHDKDFFGKLTRVGFDPGDVVRGQCYENQDDGEPIEPFSKGGEFTPVPVDPFEGSDESIPLAGPAGFGEPTPTRFTFESGELLTFDPAAQASLVSGVLPVLGTGALAGKPAAKKSFIAIDFAACIAGNKPWGGREVTPGLVVYIAAEGQGGMAKRLTACFTKRGLSVAERRNVKLLRVAPNLGVRGGDGAALVGAIRVVANGAAVRMIVVDTLVRTLGGAEENGMGMASFMDNATQIATELDTFVLAIHHPSKGDEVLRGHSSLEGGLDVVLSVSSEKGLLESQMFVHKDKDGEDGVTHAVEFERVVLGADKQGQPVSTLVVKDVRYMAGAGAGAPAGVSVNPSAPATMMQVLDIVHEREVFGEPARANPQAKDKSLQWIVEQRMQWEPAVVAKIIKRLEFKGLIVATDWVDPTRRNRKVLFLSEGGKQFRKRFSAPHECSTEFEDVSSGAQS